MPQEPLTANAARQPEKTQHAIRRSTRLPLEVPVRVTSLDPGVPFIEQCNTNLVNAHGCGVIVSRAIPQGLRVRVEIVSSTRSVAARVAEVVPLGGDPETWLVGLELDVPGNFWGIQYAPSDWKIQNNWPAEAVQPSDHDSIAAARQVPSRRWRLADISAGACYLESTLPFPAGTAVLMSIRVSDNECLLEGIVRVSHADTGMGVEFTRAQGDLSARVDELIDRLTSSREVPRIFVGQKEGHVAQDQDNAPADPLIQAKADPLRSLIREGTSLTPEQFLIDLRAQRASKRRDTRGEHSSSVLQPGQP